MASSEETPVDPRTLQSPDKATQHFIVHNIAKKHNVGTLARCATAFGVKSIVLIGSNSYNTFGCKGASNHVDFTYYPTLGEAREGVKRDLGVTKILGVEIVEGAVPIEDHPFDGNTAFIMGNEGEGMTPNQKAICDGFVYIRQYGPGTASLNVAVAASIVMHHFSLWAGTSLPPFIHPFLAPLNPSDPQERAHIFPSRVHPRGSLASTLGQLTLYTGGIRGARSGGREVRPRRAAAARPRAGRRRGGPR